MYNNAKELMNRQKKLIISILVTLFILIIIVIGYFLDYRITSKWTIGKVGLIKIETVLANTSIFVNEKTKITTTKENEVVEIKFSPRKNSVLVWKEGFFPWRKEFLVPSGGEIILKPIMVYQNPSGQIITNVDPEYWTIRNSIVRYSLPRESSPLFSEDGLSKIWVTEDNELLFQNASTTISVVQPDTVIKNISFYKDRNDVLIFSTLNAIYVIEATKDGGQNFMPIYKGQRPEFIRSEDDFLYVVDGETLMQVII